LLKKQEFLMLGRKNQKGMTLLETIIALTMAGILITAAIGIYLVHHKGWLIQEQVSDMQQNARVAIRELTTRIRMAGYGIPGGIDPIIAANGNPDIITIYYKKEPACECTLSQNMPGKSGLLKFDGQDLSCFESNTKALIYDLTTQTGEFFYIPDLNKGNKEMMHTPSDLSKSYPAGSIVFSIEVFTFYLDKLTDPDHPRLMEIKSDTIPRVFAEGIEDLQFIYSLANGVYTDSPPTGRIIREVNISLTAKTEKEDLQFAGDYRRRTYVSSVKVRNLGLQ
jgi:prepilin-type N-terminal cleavage/methylation domain-containing protein